MNGWKNKLLCAACTAALALILGACETAEDEFINKRLADICDDAYWICNVSTGCVLDEDHYVEGIFPGIRRVVIATKEPDTSLMIRIFFSSMESPGTELLAQLYEPDCSTSTPDLSRKHLQDVDLFKEAGDDRTLIFEMEAVAEGEHLLEIYSDASAKYLLIADKK